MLCLASEFPHLFLFPFLFLSSFPITNPIQPNPTHQLKTKIQKTRFHLSSYLSPILSLQVWSFALLYCLSGTIGYGINFALPLILHKGMGLSTPVSQCLVTPPYLAAAGVTWIEAYYADQWRVRSPFILGNCVAVGVGMLIFYLFFSFCLWISRPHESKKIANVV